MMMSRMRTSKVRIFLLAFALFFTPRFVFAQSDSSFFSPSSPSIVSLSEVERRLSFLDSSETIWRDLLESLFQDTTSLADTARASFYDVAQSVDRVFKSQLLDVRTRLTDTSERSILLVSERIHQQQARLADTMLMLYDSLSRTFDAMLAPKSLARTAFSEDYQELLTSLLASRTSAHRLQFSTAYQSRSVWRGIEQNSGNGAYSLSGLYQHRSGIFLTANALGLQGQAMMIDQVSASVGLDYELFDRFLLSIAYTRHYYSESSVQASAFINSDFTLWLSFQTEWLTPSVMLLRAFSDEGNEFFCSWEISRAFFLSQFSRGKLALVPSISGEYGTISTVNIQRQRRTRLNQEPQTRIQQSSPFVLTNYLFSLSLLYSIGDFSIAPELLLVFPINLPSLTLDSTIREPFTRTIKPQESSFGYFSVNVSYSL
jgi:hypothetical protein